MLLSVVVVLVGLVVALVGATWAGRWLSASIRKGDHALQLEAYRAGLADGWRMRREADLVGVADDPSVADAFYESNDWRMRENAD